MQSARSHGVSGIQARILLQMSGQDGAGVLMSGELASRRCVAQRLHCVALYLPCHSAYILHLLVVLSGSYKNVYMTWDLAFEQPMVPNLEGGCTVWMKVGQQA